ncbi:MAG: endonuclease NucS [Trueperaceae bacterium]
MLEAHLIRPDAEALLAFLRDHLRQPGTMLQVGGEMEVVYHGRAASSADAGDYLLLLKPDGSLQVHAPRGIKPLNWQPRVDALDVELDAGRVALTAERRTPREIVRVTCLDPSFALALRPRDEAGFVLQGSEAQMQRALARRPDLIEDGLTLLEVELPTGVGGVDLYARDAGGRLVVVELKRGRATHDAVHQLERYVVRIRDATGGEVRGILAAPEITAPARTRLGELGLEYREVTALPDDDDGGAEQPTLFG